MKWLISLIFLTLIFVVSGFFIPRNLVFAYRFMTFGMAAISILFYVITVKNNPKNIGGNLLAIIVKFMLSSLLFMVYFIITHSKNKTDYYFFILAYLLYSLVCYTGAYYFSKKNEPYS